jgi:hypothetical protein
LRKTEEVFEVELFKEEDYVTTLTLPKYPNEDKMLELFETHKADNLTVHKYTKKVERDLEREIANAVRTFESRNRHKRCTAVFVSPNVFKQLESSACPYGVRIYEVAGLESDVIHVS